MQSFYHNRKGSVVLAMNPPANPHPSAPWFRVEKGDHKIHLTFGGAWACRHLGNVEADLAASVQDHISQVVPAQVVIDEGCVMDTAGACLIAQTIKSLKKRKREVDVIIPSPSSLLDYFLNFRPTVKSFRPRLNWKIRWLDHIGHGAVVLSQTALKMLDFFGQVIVTVVQMIKSFVGLRWVSVFRHGEDIGIKALPIVALISFLIGMVLSYQSVNQLRRFGAEIYTIDFLGVSILREIAVLLTAIVVAGRSGSAFTAQIGTMALNQEIDAIRMLGLSPIQVLVLPRLVAILVCLPILVFFSMVIGLLGGLVMANLLMDVTPTQFTHHFQSAVSLGTFWVGMVKAPLFAIIIGLVGTFRGFQVKGSAESVGQMTTRSVVESIFLVIVCDAFMSILFSYLGV